MLVIVAEDASANTKKLFHDKCSMVKSRYKEYGTKEELAGPSADLEISVGVCDVDWQMHSSSN